MVHSVDGSLGITRSNSLSSEASSDSSSESRLRGKLENRRSILNQLDDGKIRRTENAGKKDIFEEKKKNKHQADPNPLCSKVKSKEVKSYLTNAMSPSTTENLRCLREVTSRSISRSRQRKEAAEERLKGLFNAATKSGSFDTGSRSEDTSVTRLKNRSSSESSEIHLPPRINRTLFGSDETLENDGNNLIRPKARKANLLSDIGNLSVSIDNSTSIIKNCQTKEHYSQQMNISVSDNFFVFKL